MFWLRSQAGVDRGFPKSRVFLWRRILTSRDLAVSRARRGTAWPFWPQRLREHLRHNSYQTTVLNSRTAGQRLHTDRTYWTLHYGNQTISPKLETIATALICVKARNR